MVFEINGAFDLCILAELLVGGVADGEGDSVCAVVKGAFPSVMGASEEVGVGEQWGSAALALVDGNVSLPAVAVLGGKQDTGVLGETIDGSRLGAGEVKLADEI